MTWLWKSSSCTQVTAAESPTSFQENKLQSGGSSQKPQEAPSCPVLQERDLQEEPHTHEGPTGGAQPWNSNQSSTLSCSALDDIISI